MIFYRKAHGKINWILKVFPKKKNCNKHEIDSVMQLFLPIYDKIKITKSNKLEINYFISRRTKKTYPDCLITKSINWLKINFPNIDINYKINLKKLIPEKSGFGGESSDAGFVLRYILSKNNIKLTKEHLLDLALNVGSDIPFFLCRYECAHVNEYGNRVIPQKPIKLNLEYYPNESKLSTKNVYDELDNDNQYISQVSDVKVLYQELLIDNYQIDAIYNDLQKYVFKLDSNLLQHFNNLNKFQKRRIFINGAGSYFIIIK